MSRQIHGHEVMQMMLRSGNAYTKDSLRTAIHKNFGINAKFYTCSAENMTADELIDFLNARGKFLVENNGFVTRESMICDHD